MPAFRQVLDQTLPMQAGMSQKRFSNLRSDLAAALAESGLQPILATASLSLDDKWKELLDAAGPGIGRRVGRFARWCSAWQICPADVDDDVLRRFTIEIDASTLIRNCATLPRSIAKAWNELVKTPAGAGLGRLTHRQVPVQGARVPWGDFSATFREDVENHLRWCAAADPFAREVRENPLSPGTRRLRLDHIHSAASAAVNAGVAISDLVGLASLTEPDVAKALLRHLWQSKDKTFTAYIHGVAGTLVAVAKEWVKPSEATISALKKLRKPIKLQTGLTQKNREFLRQFDDPKVLQDLIALPDRLWRRSRKGLETSRRHFVDLQSALAVDFLLHIPLRMENLSTLDLDRHIHWPRGEGKAALLALSAEETKGKLALEFEIPLHIANRILLYRNQIAPAVTGLRPNALFVTWKGKPRGQEALAHCIAKVLRDHLGVRMTPHQFRHLCAKVILDANPGAYELVRQMLGHKNQKTTVNNYAGIDTLRAGKAHAELMMKLREEKLKKKRKRKKLKTPEE